MNGLGGESRRNGSSIAVIRNLSTRNWSRSFRRRFYDQWRRVTRKVHILSPPHGLDRLSGLIDPIGDKYVLGKVVKVHLRIRTSITPIDRIYLS